MYLKEVVLLILLSIISQSCISQNESKINVIAHRGGAKLAPENTISSFKNAIKLGVDMIEIDVILSKDGEVIVIHDKTIDRTTDGSGIVKQMTLEELKKYDAGSWFDQKFIGEEIPTLSEVLEIINAQVILLIEIKGGDEEYPGLEKGVFELIEKYKAENWVIVQSFNEKTVLRFEKNKPDLVTYFLLGRNFEEYYNSKFIDSENENNLIFQFDGIAPHHSVLDSVRVSKLRENGLKIFTWTVNKIEDMDRIIELNLDGIITDSPDILIELLNNKNIQR